MDSVVECADIADEGVGSSVYELEEDEAGVSDVNDTDDVLTTNCGLGITLVT